MKNDAKSNWLSYKVQLFWEGHEKMEKFPNFIWRYSER